MSLKEQNRTFNPPGMSQALLRRLPAAPALSPSGDETTYSGKGLISATHELAPDEEPGAADNK